MTEEDAIKRIKDFGLYHAIKDLPHSMRTVEAFEMAIEALKWQKANKPRNGTWIKMSDADGDYYVCDQCGEELPRYVTKQSTWDNLYPKKCSIDKTDFCPNCGARMEG